MAESYNKIHLEFQNLTVSGNGKKILDNVSGEVRPGEVVAIMGPSGSGKSTLLNFISGREHGMTMDGGKILVNGEAITKAHRRRIGYVTQEDLFFTHLTVQQTLDFIKEMRLPDSMKKEQKRQIVEKVVGQLGLEKCLNTAIGGGFFVTGCSGGEKKRCSIAVELITNPALLILDEPTTGLDSSTAHSLILTVKELAKKQKRAVLLTIHQPSSHVFHLFDKLFLIADGKTIYNGNVRNVIKFFEHIDMPCFLNWNPADFIMEQLTTGKEKTDEMASKYEELKSNPETKYLFDADFNEAVDTDEGEMTDGDCHDSVVANIHAVGDDNKREGRKVFRDSSYVDDSSKAPRMQPKWPTGYITQTKALSKRAFIQSSKEIWDLQTFIQTFFISVIVGLLWLNTPYDEDSLKDRTGIIFYTLSYLVMIPMFHALMSFPAERNAIAKERASGMYRLSAYYTAKCLSELPVIFFQPVIFYAIVYWMSGLNRSPMFLVGVLEIITLALVAQTFGLCIGSTITNFKHSITFTIIFSNCCILVGGFFTRGIPFWLSWLKYGSHITYAYNVMIRIEFEYATKAFECATKSVFPICKTNTTNYLQGSDVLPTVTTIDFGIGASFGMLWGYIVLFRIVFYFLLKYFNKPN